MGADRGQPEASIWTRAAEANPAQPGEYRPRRAKPGPPDPYQLRPEQPLRSGPYLRPGSVSASERPAAAQPDPLRDPVPPDPAPPKEQAGQPVASSAFGWWNSNVKVAAGQHPDCPAPPGPGPRDGAGRAAPSAGRPDPAREQHATRQPSVWDQPAAQPSVWDKPAGEQSAREQEVPGPSAWHEPARVQPAREQPAPDQSAGGQPAWGEPARERSSGEQAAAGHAAPVQAARKQPAREESARQEPAPWHTGKLNIQDEPVSVRPTGARGGTPQPDADRYPADFPTQVFMSSALAAWQQPAQAAPVGNWPRIEDPALAPGRPAPAAPPAPGDPRPAPAVTRSADPRSASAAARPGDLRSAPAAARSGGPRHAQPASPPGGPKPPWDRGPVGGPSPAGEGYPAAGAHRATAQHLGAPFPPAQDPAELYPAASTPGWPAAQPSARSRPPAQRRGLGTGLLAGAACLAALIIIGLILLVALPG